MNYLSVRFLGVTLGVAAATGPTPAAVLTNVPMQGTMVMPMIRYAAADGRLHATADPTVPQLTPLLVSNPADQFDSADPWYQSLDPRAQGLAFSRRYGFVMDTMSDPLPGGSAIWIRKLASSPGLEIHRYRSSAPKVWEPIFGTAGAPDALQWDGTMFHPCVAAPPGTNAYAATFEAVLVDSLSGTEMPGTGTGPFQLNWTDVPDGRPELTIGCRVAITCPSTNGWALEVTGRLQPANWTIVTNLPAWVDGQPTVVLNPSAAEKFYRMRRIP